VVQQDQEVDELLRRGLQEEALASQDRLNQSRVLAAQMTERVQALAGELAGLVEAKARLDARITALRQNEPAMEGLVGLARAKELTAAAMSSLDDLAGAGDPDVARVVGSIRTRLAEAEAQIRELEQRALAHGETPDVLKRRQLEDQLEARKARLGLSTGALDGESPGSGPQQPVNS
jgi:chromosome segregation ATPase